MNFFRNLQRRERLFVVGAGALLVLFLIFKLTIDPMLKRSADLDRQLVTARRQLGELRTMQQEYQRQKSVVASINNQLKKQQKPVILLSMPKGHHFLNMVRYKDIDNTPK